MFVITENIMKRPVFHATFPQHWTHYLQPFDVLVKGSFKAKYGAAQNDWMMANLGGIKISI
jgi:hypothetical protein